MKCKSCNFENIDDAIFCANCGSTLGYDNKNEFSQKYPTPIGTNNTSDNRPSTDKASTDKASTNKTVIVIAVAVVFIVLIAAVAVVVVMKNKGNANNSQEDTFSVNNDDYSAEDYDNNYDYNYDFGNNETYTVSNDHTYEVIKMDCTWTQAMNECRSRGGHLATITSVAEYNKICSLADQVDGLKYIWLGAQVNAGSTNWSNAWITDETWSFEKWYKNEPSGYDNDGTVENCLCMWNVKQDGTYIGWTFNDQRNDIISVLPTVSGKIGFVCEYE